MPTVEFNFPSEKIRVNRSMLTPKKFTDLNHWYKSARKAIPSIPKLSEPTPDGILWRYISDPDVSLDWIRFDIENTMGQRAHVVINRRDNLFGRG